MVRYPAGCSHCTSYFLRPFAASLQIPHQATSAYLLQHRGRSADLLGFGRQEHLGYPSHQCLRGHTGHQTSALFLTGVCSVYSETRLDKPLVSATCHQVTQDMLRQSLVSSCGITVKGSPPCLVMQLRSNTQGGRPLTRCDDGRLVQLLESDVVRVLSEALTAQVEAVLPDQTMPVGAGPASDPPRELS